jgi:hypothetical protein
MQYVITYAQIIYDKETPCDVSAHTLKQNYSCI